MQDPMFVFCAKPNIESKAMSFDPAYVSPQVRKERASDRCGRFKQPPSPSLYFSPSIPSLKN